MQTNFFSFYILFFNSFVLIYAQVPTATDSVSGLPILPTTAQTLPTAPVIGGLGAGSQATTGLPLGSGNLVQMSPCPAGAQPLTDDGGRPRKCLPRHSEMCNSPGACCYFNQIDYFCCVGVTTCPSYGNVTLVIYRGLNPGGGSPYESFFAQNPRVNVPNFDQYPGIRGPSPSYGGIPASVAPPQPYPSPPPPPAYPSPPPPPAYPSPATLAPAGYQTPAPAPSVGYGSNIPVNNNKLCPTCMGQNVAPLPGQAFIPIMPDNGIMHFVMPQGNAICPTCGTNQQVGGYGNVPAPIPSPSYSAIPIPAVPQPSPSYSSQPLPSGSPTVLQQPNVLCPTCKQQENLPSSVGGYNIPQPVTLQPVSGYGVNPVVNPSPGYGNNVAPTIPSQSNPLCPTCSLQPGNFIPQPQTPLRYDSTGNLISTGSTQNNYGGSTPVRVPSSYSEPAKIVPIQPSPSSYSAPAPSFQPSTGYGQPSGNVGNPLCPTCGLQQPPPGMPFIAIQPGATNSSMQFVMPQPGVLCPTCNIQPTVVSSYPIPGPPSPRSYGGTIPNPQPPPSPYGGQQPVPNVIPSLVPSYSSVPSGFVNPNLPPDQGFGVVPTPIPTPIPLVDNVTGINPPPVFPPPQPQNGTAPPVIPPPQPQNGTALPVLNPTEEWKPGGGFPPSKFGARRLPVLKQLPAGENPNFLDFLRLLKDSNDDSKGQRQIRSYGWR